MHLRIGSNSVEDDLAQTQSIPPGDHVVAAAYSLEGTGIDVLTTSAVVYLSSGTNGTNGTVDVKIQESDDDVTYTDVSGGAFAQVTEANDNATYEIAYSGIKQYIRAVATVAVATCDFGVNVVTVSPLSIEDDYLTALITTSRRLVELHSTRRFITQTWQIALDEFPSSNRIILPHSPLQSVSSVNYYDVDSTEATFTSDDYEVDTFREPGQIVLGDSKQWPTTTLRTVNGVIVEYKLGYGDARSDVPEMYKQAIKILAAEIYEHREDSDFREFKNLPWGVKVILGYERRTPV
jgi:uncharacterized phiE125 gp8 family phage protein